MANPAEVKEALLKALNNNDVPPEILVKWFDRKMEPAAKEALSAAGVADVNKNLVSEKEYNELEGQVKDSLLKQKASLQSEFSKMLTQVNLKDPEEAKKMFPPEITKQFDEKLTKELEKATQEAQKQSAKEEETNKLKRYIIMAFLLLCGVSKNDTDDKFIRDNLQALLSFCGFKDNEIKDIVNLMKGYTGLHGADILRTKNSGYVQFIESMMNGNKSDAEIKQKWNEFKNPIGLFKADETVQQLMGQMKEVNTNNFLKLLKNFKQQTGQEQGTSEEQSTD